MSSVLEEKVVSVRCCLSVALVLASTVCGASSVALASSERNAVDAFVRPLLEEKGLAPSPEAGMLELYRRLSFDLTGLPPSRSDFEAAEERGYGATVDSFLNSPHFGERMASMWLNVARYAEDQAHQVGANTEHHYPNAYLYRRWVIDAFNRDLPFDQFVKLQLAADQFDFATEADTPALGFLGLGPKYYSRGRLDVMADEWEDRVDTVTRGFLGLTVACARCHDHKFDPISTEDYHALAGIFASTKMVNKRYGEQPEEWPEKKVDQLLYTTHVVEDGDVKDLNVFIRGNVDRKGPLVPRRFLSLFYEGEPPRFTQGSGRKELAEVIASPSNPMTAKVYVNRVWQMLFGQGLVRTPSNFGALGDEPSHPDLLDELARRFVGHGWSTKWLVREIVSSATYRQSSLSDEKNEAIDADNRFLWRMNRRRLPVEMWRDAVLFVAGELDYRGGRSLELDDPDNRRRTVYGRVSRLKLNPMLMHYDYPDPNVHSAKRAVTTTPLQKLFSMNSEFVVDLAGALSQKLTAGKTSDEERIREAYRLVYFRNPSDEELRLGLRFLETANDDVTERWQLYSQALLTANEAFYVD